VYRAWYSSRLALELTGFFLMFARKQTQSPRAQLHWLILARSRGVYRAWYSSRLALELTGVCLGSRCKGRKISAKPSEFPRISQAQFAGERKPRDMQGQSQEVLNGHRTNAGRAEAVQIASGEQKTRRRRLRRVNLISEQRRCLKLAPFQRSLGDGLRLPSCPIKTSVSKS